MAIPLALGLLAGAGALKGVGAKLGQKKAAQNAYAQAEDERKRRQSAFELSDLPQLHGAEQRKTMGNLFARGMWGNFGRDPRSGAARSPELQAILNDPWVYRNASTLKGLSPHMAPLPKPKGPGLAGYLGGALGGAAEGAGAYYSMGGDFGFGPPKSGLQKAQGILQKRGGVNLARDLQVPLATSLRGYA
jgi:hypothetical protein